MRRIIKRIKVQIMIRRFKKSGFSERTIEILGDAMRKAMLKYEESRKSKNEQISNN